MTIVLTDALCAHCGLCCDGTLFADVELSGPAEAVRVEALGLEIDDDEPGRPLLLQPCRALDGTSCRVYEHRPGCCRTFECRLLRAAGRGAIPVADALATIRGVRRRLARVSLLLEKLGATNERLPLLERCAEQIADETVVDAGTTRMRKALATEVRAVRAVLRRAFL